MKPGLLAPALALVIAAGVAEPTNPCSNLRLIRVMYQRYAGEWYANLNLEQKARVLKDRKLDGKEIWTEIIQLPGKVCGNIGNPAAGNPEMYVTDTNYLFPNRAPVPQAKAVHTVLPFEFDVYCQPPVRTIARAQ